MKILFGIAILSILVLAGCSQKGFHVSQADYGDEWPLTVSEGYVYSEGTAAYFETPDGTRYALNGIAKGRGGRDIWSIQRDDPKFPEELIRQGARPSKMSTGLLREIADQHPK